jgi:hypothetical protein
VVSRRRPTCGLPNITRVNPGLFWRALGIQGVVVGVVFAALAAAFSKDFFGDWGFAVGPIAWISCSFLTARVLSLPISFVLFAGLAGGVAGTIVLIAVNHWAGLAAALLVFAASCAGYEPEPGDSGDRTPGGERSASKA